MTSSEPQVNRTCTKPAQSTPTFSAEMSSEVQVYIGDLLQSSTTSYEVLDFSGEGIFGKVAKCRDSMTSELVAVKIHKEIEDGSVEWELEMLEKVRTLDPDKSNIVKFIDHFTYNNSSCLAFEMLDMSLWDLMKKHRQPLSLNKIRPVTQQLLVAFEALKRIGIMHTDLKLDNVMLVNQRDQPFRIKLIDFGLALSSSEVELGTKMQAKSYRAPEVTLGLPLSEAVDMWGVGCVMAFLYFATHIFPSKCPYYRIKTMVHLVGQPAEHHMLAGQSIWMYFIRDPDVGWRLRTPEDYEAVTGEKPEVHKRYFDFVKDLMDAVMSYQPKTDDVENKDRREFLDLLRCCLNPNPELRVTPREALKHNFVTMAHLRDEVTASLYTDAALQLMNVSLLEKPEEPDDNMAHEDNSHPAVMTDVHNNPSWHHGKSSLSLSEDDADVENVRIDIDSDSNIINNRNCCSHSNSFSSKCPSSPTGDKQPNTQPGPSAATNTPFKEEPSCAAHNNNCTSSSGLPVASDKNNKSSPADAKPTDGTAVFNPSKKKTPKKNVFQRLNKFFGRAKRRVISLFALAGKQSNPPTKPPPPPPTIQDIQLFSPPQPSFTKAFQVSALS